MSKRPLFALSLAITLALSSTTSAVTIITPTLSSSANLNSFGGTSATQLIDNSGLSAAVNTGASLAFAQAATHIFDGGFAQSWVTNTNGADYFSPAPPGGNPTFVWDLGSDVVVNNIVLWQYQNNGGNGTSVGNDTRTITLQFNTAAQGNAVFAGLPTGLTMLNMIALAPTNSAQTFSTGDQIARYVRMTVTDNYFGTGGVTGGGDRVGLGELRFDVSPVIPEPATATLGLLAFGGLMLRRRRVA